jgi:8-amino-7-oxononanoate synthase
MTGVATGNWLAQAAGERAAAGLGRRLHPRRPGESWLDLAGNDYLGLARDPRVLAAATDALIRWGAGATGSRLVTGTTQLHTDLEAALARFAGAEAALVFSSGYAANLGAVTALAGPGTLVLSDEACHASLIDACRLTRSRVEVTPHADVAAVRHALAERSEPRALVITESVFSADGDLAPLADLHSACRAQGAILVADEAHALGVAGPGGRGLCVSAGIAGEPDVVRTVTLSKSLGSQGGAVLGSALVIEHLLNTARTFIFDTGLAPVCVAAALRALEILASQPDLAARVGANAHVIAWSLGVLPPQASIVPVVLGDPDRAVAISERCREHGVLIGCFRPPSVPPGTSRLRLTARADLTEAQLVRATTVVRDAIAGTS